MSQNVEQLLLRVEASTALMRQELSRGEQSLDGLAKKTEQTEGRMRGSFQRIDRSAKQSQMGFQQLGFQISDVSAQLANGTSGLTVFAQQSGQVAFALSQFGGTVGRVGAFLTGPWGAALAAGAIALGVLTRRSAEAGDAAESMGDKYGEAGYQIEAALDGAKAEAEEFKAIANDVLGAIGDFSIQAAGKVAKGINLLADFTQRTEGIIPRALDKLALGGTAAGDAISLLKPSALGADGRPLSRTAGRGPDLLTRQSADVALFGEKFLQDWLKSSNQKASSTRSRSSGGSSRAAKDLFDRDDAASSAFQDVAARLTAGAASPLQGIKTDLDVVQRKAAEVGAAFSEQFAKGEAFAKEISRNLAQGIVFGKGIGDALVNSFKAAAAEALASGLFSILRGLAGGSSFGDALAGAFSNFGGFKAAGGAVSGGRSYIVGERGPELFMPRAAGSIIPNHALGGGSSEIVVRTEPSELFVTTVVAAGQAGGAEAAGRVIRRANRGGLMGSRG